jgi:hypothetical protein
LNLLPPHLPFTQSQNPRIFRAFSRYIKLPTPPLFH